MSGVPDTPLAVKLRRQLAGGRHMSVADYMSACLQDPEHGYYRRQPAIGAGGDFITAPEISQVFGEFVGLWCAVAWRAMGAPSAVRLIEVGPGRGTLMRDALRAGRVVPGFRDAILIHLVESHAGLADLQRGALAHEGASAEWHARLEDVPDGPSIVVANEFLDALPVEQLVHDGAQWRRRGVGLDSHGAFQFVTGDALPFDEAAPWPPAAGAGDIFEYRPAFHHLCGLLARRAPTGLAALFIDYAHTRQAIGETLQAVLAHRYVSPFEQPGEADLSAHVDFDDFAKAAQQAGLAPDGPISQAEFLLGLGLVERTERLMTSAGPARAGLIEAGARRIADPSGMGALFKAVALRSPGIPTLPPFVPAAHARAG